MAFFGTVAILSTLLLVVAGAAQRDDALAALPPGGLVASSPNVGWTEGKFSVSDDGAAQYHLPLWTPEARGDVRPDLALAYDSRSGNGLLGVGWSLTGLSQISPCPRTLAQDGEVRGVSFSPSDVYCLDGNRLVPVGPVSNNQREYRTERDTFARIVSFGAANTVPSSFRVWTKEGRILTFGEQTEEVHGQLNAYRLAAGPSFTDPTLERPSTRVIAAWQLTKVEDRNGNQATIDYLTSEGDAANLWYAQSVPSMIHYSPDRAVKFTYEGRPDPIDTFTAGVHTRITARIKTIQMFAGGELLREYRLGYPDTSVTGRSLLGTVTECDHNLVACQHGLRFRWSLGTDDFQAIETTVTDAGTSDNSGRIIETGDVDGDGRDDIVYADALDQWGIRRGTSTGNFTSAVLAGIPGVDPNRLRPAARAIDFDRDGRLDLMVTRPHPDLSPLTPIYYLYRSNGATFSEYLPDVDPENDHPALDPPYFLDLDGNGMPDYAAPETSFPFQHPWRFRLNTGTGFGPMQHTEQDQGDFGWVDVLDADGDGKASLLRHPNQADHFELISYTNGGLTDTTVNLKMFPSTMDNRRDFADVNGDGLPDAVYPYHGLQVQLNSGNGFGPMLPGPGQYVNPITPQGDFVPGVRIADFDNDGAQDIMTFQLGDPTGPADFEHGIQLYTWRNNGFVRIPVDRSAGKATFFGWAPMQPLDIDGNGRLDLVLLKAGSPDHLQVLRRQGDLPDLLTGVSVLDLGERVRVTYSNLGDRTVHTPGTCTYPLTCPRRGSVIVSRHQLATGLASPQDWNQYTHTYEGARVDLHGRGWLGFARHTVTDQQTGGTLVTTFNNSTMDSTAGVEVYPGAFLPSISTFSQLDQPGGKIYQRRVENTNVLRPLAVPHTYTIEPRTTVDRDEEQAAPGSGQFVMQHQLTTTREFDGFGNETRDSAANAGGRTVTMSMVYDNDTSAWLIGKLRHLTTVSCTFDLRCGTRESEYTFDTVGNLRTEVVEPNRPALKVTTTLVRGTFGVIDSVSAGDNAGQTRTTTIEYDSQRMTRTAVTDALGHRTTMTFHSGLGVLLSVTDPNGASSTMRYDWFGRPREVTTADGSFQQFSYVSSGPTHIISTTFSGGGATTRWLDRLGRPVLEGRRTFAGAMSSTTTAYNRFGLVANTSRPFVGDEPAQLTTIRYDNHGRPISRAEADGATVTFIYSGRNIDTIDARGTRGSAIVNTDGQVVTRYEDDPNSTVLLPTSFGYGPFGEVTTTTAPDLTSQAIGYDALGQPTSISDPSTGSSTATYTAFGELATVTDAENRTTEYRYDALGRITRMISPDGVATNTWDTAPHGIGNLTNSRSADGIGINYRYDNLGRPSTVAWNVDGTQYEFGFGYDDIGRQSTVTYPEIPGATADGRLTLQYAYNANGYLREVRNAATPADPAYWTAEARDSAGQLTRERFGNGIVTDYAYQASTGLLQSITGTGPGTLGTVESIAYGYDRNRNVTQRHDSVNKRFEVFGYDTLNRLTSWQALVPGPGYVGMTASFRYDTVGNLTTETSQVQGQAAQTVTYRYGENGAPAHALTGRNSITYTYDRDGRQLTGPQRTVTYTALNLPKTVDFGQSGHVEYAYDATGARVRKTLADGQSTLTLGGLFERRTPAGTGGREIHNLHNIVVDGRVVAQLNRVQAAAGGPLTATRINYLHADLQGSTVMVTNSAGLPTGDESRLARQFYDPFGQRVDEQYQPLGRQGHGGPHQGYTGQEHDDEQDLINMGGRVYAPEDRRFLTPDPFVVDPLSSQAYNRYAYVGNNPATLTDPTGFAPGDPDDTITAAPAGPARPVEKIDTSDAEAAAAASLKAAGTSNPGPAPSTGDNHKVNTDQGKRPPRPPQEQKSAGRVVQEFVSTFIMGNLPPSLVGAYDKRAYVGEYWDFGHQGNTVQYMADRVSARWGYGSTHLNYWANTVISPVAAFTSAAGSVLGGLSTLAARTAQASPALARRVVQLVERTGIPLAQGLRTAARDSTVVLMDLRTAAVEATGEVQSMLGRTFKPTEFGNMADAIFKARVQQAIEAGVLPKTLQVTPRFVRGPDVVDWTTGLAWDLTTATVRQVAGHDQRYIGMVLEGPLGKVTIMDVLPLVYSRP